jgi:hypothetical protein
MKCDCGLSYVPGHPDDETYHAQIHAEYLSGPEIPVIRLLSPCATDGPLPIYVVDGTCLEAIRCALARVAMVAHRSMPEYPAGYDGTVTEDDQRLYLAADGARIVAMALTTLDDAFWRLAWQADGSLTLIEPVASISRSHKIARVWTAAAYRRRGLALRLIQTASGLLPCAIADLGWELPFTPGGARLVQCLCPEVFWACCDTFTLQEVLQTAPA